MLQELTNKIKKIIPEIDIPSKVFEGVYKSRQITLEDVLRCLVEKHKYYNEDIVILTDGTIGSKDGTIQAQWLLGKPLHEQSEETIKELNKLI